MRDPDHDEIRVLKNWLPTGMINPANHQQPRLVIIIMDQ